jgi:hypothetical protein
LMNIRNNVSSNNKLTTTDREKVCPHSCKEEAMHTVNHA